MNRQNDYIQHMKTAIQDTLIYVEGLAFDEFLEDKRTQQACIMNLIIIGEASTKLMNECGEFTQQNPHIEWRSMRGMRNRIAHGYFDIDLAVVWETIQTALPDLLTKLENIR